MSRKRAEPLNEIVKIVAQNCAQMVLHSSLYGRRVAVFNLEDLPRVSALKWHLHNLSGKLYITATPPVSLRWPTRTIHLHRLIAGFPEGKVVDHIDGDPMNNLRSNLRVCSQAENVLNRKGNKESKTGLKGVVASGMKFRAYIGHHGRQHYLGTFPSRHQAAEAYNEAAIKLHGQFARLNQIAA